MDFMQTRRADPGLFHTALSPIPVRWSKKKKQLVQVPRHQRGSRLYLIGPLLPKTLLEKPGERLTTMGATAPVFLGRQI